MIDMQRLILFCSLLGSFLVPAQLSAQDDLLNWEVCVQKALIDHPQLREAREDLIQAGEDKIIAQSGLLPQVTASLSETTSKSAGSDSSESYGYGVTASQLLFDGNKTIHQIDSARASVKSAGYNYDVVSAAVRNRLRVAFIRLLKGQELILITETIANRRKQNRELVELRYEAGREHRGALLTARADLAQAEFEVSRAKRNLRLARRRLLKELGVSEFKEFSLTGSLAIETIERHLPDFDAVAVRTPTLKDLKARYEQAGYSLKAARADFFPTLSLSSSLNRSDSDWPPKDEGWSVGFAVSLPIFEGGQRLASINKSKSALREAAADQVDNQQSVILALEEAWKVWQDALDFLKVRQQFLEANRERSRIAEAEYSAGLLDFDDWTIIEDSLVSAETSFIDAQESAHLAESNWFLAAGVRLEDE